MEKTDRDKAKEKTSTEAAGFLFSMPGLLTLLGILLLAAWFNQFLIAVLTALVLSAALLTRLWSRVALVGVTCRRFLNESRAFPGESIDLRMRLLNRKVIPLPWVAAEDQIPDGLTIENPASVLGTKPGINLVGRVVSLLWYEGMSWRYRLTCRRRGYYPLGPLVVTSGDIFGLYPRSRTQAADDEIIVYPKIFTLPRFALPSSYPLGETKAEKRIFADATRPIGIRDYAPGDSFRYVHWKASARHQNLQVKVFEPTTTLKTIIFLAVDSFPKTEESPDGTFVLFPEVDPHFEENFELGISLAASIASTVSQQRNQVGLFANTKLADSGQPVRIPPGRGNSQLVEILEALAKVTFSESGKFHEFLQEQRAAFSWGNTIVMVIARPPLHLPELVADLKASGHKVVVFQIGNYPVSEELEGISWYNAMLTKNSIELTVRQVA